VPQVVEREKGASRRQPAQVAVQDDAACVRHAHRFEDGIQVRHLGQLVRQPIALGDDGGQGQEARAGHVPRVVRGPIAAHVDDHRGRVVQARGKLRGADQEIGIDALRSGGLCDAQRRQRGEGSKVAVCLHRPAPYRF
jgi:hypothetical protein